MTYLSQSYLRLVYTVTGILLLSHIDGGRLGAYWKSFGVKQTWLAIINGFKDGLITIEPMSTGTSIQPFNLARTLLTDPSM